MTGCEAGPCLLKDDNSGTTSHFWMMQAAEVGLCIHILRRRDFHQTDLVATFTLRLEAGETSTERVTSIGDRMCRMLDDDIREIAKVSA